MHRYRECLAPVIIVMVDRFWSFPDDKPPVHDVLCSIRRKETIVVIKLGQCACRGYHEHDTVIPLKRDAPYLEISRRPFLETPENSRARKLYFAFLPKISHVFLLENRFHVLNSFN
ncbi:predicted protein, partial [Nematostella vectensis]